MQLSNKGDPNNGYRYFDGSWFLCIYRCNLDVWSERRASLSLSSFSYFKVLLDYAIFKSSNLQIFKSSNLQIFKSSNLQIFKSSNLQIFKSSNLQIILIKNNISNICCYKAKAFDSVKSFNFYVHTNRLCYLIVIYAYSFSK